jgi:hypothetical protein
VNANREPAQDTSREVKTRAAYIGADAAAAMCVIISGVEI